MQAEEGHGQEQSGSACHRVVTLPRSIYVAWFRMAAGLAPKTPADAQCGRSVAALFAAICKVAHQLKENVRRSKAGEPPRPRS